MPTAKPVAATIATGLLSVTLYAGVYLYERELLDACTRTDELYWLLPVATALLFSFVHGAFAGYVWDLLGVRAQRPGK